MYTVHAGVQTECWLHHRCESLEYYTRFLAGDVDESPPQVEIFRIKRNFKLLTIGFNEKFADGVFEIVKIRRKGLERCVHLLLLTRRPRTIKYNYFNCFRHTV